VPLLLLALTRCAACAHLLSTKAVPEDVYALALRSVLSAASRVVQAYEAQLAARPWSTQAATSALLWGAGDAAAQSATSCSDSQRLAVTTLYGGLLIGPAGHAWLNWLDRECKRAGRSPAGAVLWKTVRCFTFLGAACAA
jgi:hypothetical protein